MNNNTRYYYGGGSGTDNKSFSKYVNYSGGKKL